MSTFGKVVKQPFTNVKTGKLHSAWATTLVGWITFLLVKFKLVTPETFDGETVAAIVGILGLLQMFWRTYFKK